MSGVDACVGTFQEPLANTTLDRSWENRWPNFDNGEAYSHGATSWQPGAALLLVACLCMQLLRPYKLRFV